MHNYCRKRVFSSLKPTNLVKAMTTTLTEEQTKELTALIEDHLRQKGLLQTDETLKVVLEVSKIPRVQILTKTNLGSLLSTPLAELNLDGRVYRPLSSYCILTVGQVLRKTEGELLRIRNFGQKGLRSVKFKLNELGLGDRLGQIIPVTDKEKEYYKTLQFNHFWWTWSDEEAIRSCGFKTLSDITSITQKECEDRLTNHTGMFKKVLKVLESCELSFKE